MYQGLESETDQADHSQVHPQQEPIDSRLVLLVEEFKQKIFEISKNIVKTESTNISESTNILKQEYRECVLDKIMNINEVIESNNQAINFMEKSLSGYDKCVTNLMKINQYKNSANLATLIKKYFTDIPTLIEESKKAIKNLDDFHKAQKISFTKQEIETIEKIDIKKVISKSENCSIEQALESLSVLISSLKKELYWVALIGIYEPIEVISEAEKTFEEITEVISEAEKIIKEIKEVKAKIEELEKGIKKPVVENNESGLNSDYDPKEQNAKKAENIESMVEMQKNIDDFPSSLTELEKIINESSKNADVVLKKLKQYPDLLEKQIDQLYKLLPYLIFDNAFPHDLYDSCDKLFLLESQDCCFTNLIVQIFCSQFEKLENMVECFRDKYKEFKIDLLDGFLQDIELLKKFLHDCIKPFKYIESRITDFISQIDSLKSEFDGCCNDFEELLSDRKMTKDDLSAISNSSENSRELSFSEYFSKIIDSKIIHDISALSKDFEEFSKTLKSVKDSSTSNNPVHEYPSSTCQAVTDINPASNSESISHSNPDEKKEIKEEAPSSNLAGCENEIVHSTNSENLSQI